MCRVNLHQKFTEFMHSDKETGFVTESTNHNQELSKKPGFWPPARQPKSGFAQCKGAPKKQELISPLSEDFRYETGVFNPWRTIGFTHNFWHSTVGLTQNLSHSIVFAFTDKSAGESIPRLIAKVGFNRLANPIQLSSINSRKNPVSGHPCVSHKFARIDSENIKL